MYCICIYAFKSELDVNKLTECMVTVYILKEAPETDRRCSRGVRDGSVLGLLARKPHEFTNTSPTGDGNLTAQEASQTLCTLRLNHYKMKVTNNMQLKISCNTMQAFLCKHKQTIKRVPI